MVPSIGQKLNLQVLKSWVGPLLLFSGIGKKKISIMPPVLDLSLNFSQRSTVLSHMAPRKLQIACAGLGRMGARHAFHFHNRTPRAQLVAAFTPDENEIQWGEAAS